jgi:xylan 1,4-beta-xylosidase
VLIGCKSYSTHENNNINFTVQADTVIGENHEFWKSLGYDFLFKIVNEPEGEEFLNRAEKNEVIKYYRSHYTFNNTSGVDERAGGKVGGNVVRIDENGNEYYDFSLVNKTFHEYVKRDMKPIVEFDFFPDGWSSGSNASKSNDESFESKSLPPKNWDKWKDLLNNFMQNLMDEFGEEELKTWYFEVWNEPDGMVYEKMPVFLESYDVFTHIVKSYSNDFKVGGPACYHLHFLKPFLDHVYNGKNYVTGKTGSPLDFISYHIYGLSGGWLLPAPDIFPQVSKFTSEMLWLQRLVEKYPTEDVEIHINEYGLSSHGDRRFVDKHPQLEYRNSEVSGLFIVKLVDCFYALEDNFDLRTDLLLYWGSWFNAATGPIFRGSRDLMTTDNIPKPMMTAYEILAKLGKDRLKINGPKAGGRYGVIATKSEKQIQVIAYNFNETDDNFSQTDNILLDINNIDASNVQITEYWFDREHHNTYRKWEEMGRPEPDKNVIKILKEEGELKPNSTYKQAVENSKINIKAPLRRHALKLYIIDLQ